MFPAVARLIGQKQLHGERTGTIFEIALLGSAGDTVAGSCFVQPSDAPAVAQAKNNRLSVADVLARIRGLTFAEFERFGAKVLRELGAHKTYVTPHSNDQGIDFYGTLSLGQLQDAPAPFFRLAHDLQVRFAGQAKHYPDAAIGTSVVRELIGAVSLARTKTFSVDKDLFEELELAPMTPLVTVLLTTGRFTSGAIELAEKAGVVARGGDQLAVFLADRGIGMVSVAGVTVFDRARFDAWLNP